MISRGRRRWLATASALIFSAAACSGSSAAVSRDKAAVRVGLVVSLTGTGSITAELAIQGAMVALVRANAEQLAGGRQVRFVEADDGSEPDAAWRACSRLVTQDHVAAIVGFESSAALDACNRAASPGHVPYFAGVPSDVEACYPGVFTFGFTPNQQVTPLIGFLAHKQGAKTFYVVAADTPVARRSVLLAALRIHDIGSVLLGTLYRPPNTVDYRSDIAKIAAARPDVVLDALTGDDEIAYHRQFQSNAGVAAVNQASLTLDVAAARSIGPAAIGIFVAQDYNSADGSPENRAWLSALMKKFGDGAVPSAVGAEMYDATLVMATAIGHAESTSGEAIAGAVGAVSIEGPRGPIHVAPGTHGYATVSAHIGRVNAMYGIDQLDVIGPVSPLACEGA